MFWSLAQIVFDIAVCAALFVFSARRVRARDEEMRLSKGLQLLSSKISILEDLSDRSERQSQQILATLDAKAREVGQKIVQADKQIQSIRVSMEKSLEVARIFQDRIPHEEIIERQTTLKYIRAARMAHRGNSVDEIVREIDLPRSEIEFISKVNRERLTFKEEELPEWARELGSEPRAESALAEEPLSPRSLEISLADVAPERAMELPRTAERAVAHAAPLRSQQEPTQSSSTVTQPSVRKFDFPRMDSRPFR